MWHAGGGSAGLAEEHSLSSLHTQQQTDHLVLAGVRLTSLLTFHEVSCERTTALSPAVGAVSKHLTLALKLTSCYRIYIYLSFVLEDC